MCTTLYWYLTLLFYFFSTYNLYYSPVHFPRGSFVWNLLCHSSQRTMSSGCIPLLGETHSHRVRGCLHQGETEVCCIAMSLGESLLPILIFGRESIAYFDLWERVYCLFWSLGESLLSISIFGRESIVYFDLWERVYCLFWSLGESLLSISIFGRESIVYFNITVFEDLLFSLLWSLFYQYTTGASLIFSLFSLCINMINI